MVTGAQAIFTRDDVEFNSVDDFIGKKYARSPTTYWLTSAIKDAGYDPVKDVEWVQLPNFADNIAAVQSGEVDFASIVTSQHYQVENIDGIKIVVYSDDFMDNHSCCRMMAKNDFVKNNPNTVKAIYKALIRAKRDFEKDKEASVKVLSDAIGTPYDHVASFMLNEHFRVSPDPLKNITVASWNMIDDTGFLGDETDKVNIEDHINVDLYEKALKEVIEEHGDEDPEYYQEQLEYFEKYNK